MPKAIVHPHPVYDFKCSDCIHWHPAYVENFALQPGTQNIIPIKQLIAQGRKFDDWITDRRSLCIHDPNWNLTGEDHYCSHFKAAKVY
jgi:hypothetical protein